MKTPVYLLRNFGWGATEAETKRPMPGDDEVKRPMSVSTNAVTIRARAADIWPWLVQMGYRWGGCIAMTG